MAILFYRHLTPAETLTPVLHLGNRPCRCNTGVRIPGQMRCNASVTLVLHSSNPGVTPRLTSPTGRPAKVTELESRCGNDGLRVQPLLG